MLDTQHEDAVNQQHEIKTPRYSETIDKLVIQNKQLQYDLSAEKERVETLTERLAESNIRISKNLFYVGLLVIGYLVYSGNDHLIKVQTQMAEVGVVLKEYKSEIDKYKLYNGIIEKSMNINPVPPTK